MDIFRLRDNRFGDNGLYFFRQEAGSFVSDSSNSEGLGRQTASEATRKILEDFGKSTLGDLTRRAGGAIVDLAGSHLDDPERQKLHFFEYHQKEKEKERFRLDTGNLMGVLRFRESNGTSLQVEVLSRFDKGSNNFFLNYLLSKAFDVGLGNDSVTATQPSVLDLLLDVLFVRRLGEAAKNGLLRQYRTYRNNDWNFKGRLDLPRHIRENFPLPHGIAYVKREIDLDVPVNRLLLLAALVVRKRRPDLFERNEDASDAFRELRTAISDPGDVRSVLSHRDCREPVRHPFYREIWEPLRQIARMILEEERWHLFHESEESVSGVVFDGAWLWEEYLDSVLSEFGYRHCVRGGNSDDTFRALLNARTGHKGSPMYPDFARKDDSGNYVALADAKYKRQGLVRADRLQMISYAFVYLPKKIYLIYPPADGKCEPDSGVDSDDLGAAFDDKYFIRTVKTRDEPRGSGIFIQTISVGKIPNENTFDSFKRTMEGEESELRMKLEAADQNGNTHE